MRDIRINIILVLLLVISYSGYSQEENWENPAGSIENAKVVIEKDKVINLRPVSRRFKSIRIDLPEPQKLTVDYQLGPTIDSLSSLQVIVRPKTMRDQPLEKLYGLSAKLGYGNYRSPFVLIDAGNKRSDEFAYNARFNHFSSGKGEVNGASYYSTRLGIDGNYFLNKVTLFGNLGYHNQSYDTYGYDPAEFATIGDMTYLMQRLNILSFNVGFDDNNLKNSSDQNFEIDFSLLKNNHFDQELLLGAAYKLNWSMATDWRLAMMVGYNLARQNNTSTTSINRHLASIKPFIAYNLDKIEFIVGVNGFFQQDQADNLDARILVYPNLGVNYALSNSHTVGFSIDGNVEQVTQHSMYGENLYLDTLQVANNNLNNIRAALSLAGNFTETLGYSLGYEFANYQRMMFYDNNPADTARFLAVLDNGGVTRQTFRGAVNLLQNENLSFRLGANYNFYSTTDQAEAWHKPEFELDFGARVTIIEKLHLRLDYSLLAGIKARESSGLVKTLTPINDLNIGADLDLTDNAGLFIEFRNIIGQNYQLYNNYPVNGLQFMGGFSFRF